MLKRSCFSGLIIIVLLIIGQSFNSKNDPQWETVITSGTSFKNQKNFNAVWNYQYPWGQDHNGSARMIGAVDQKKYPQVSLKKGNILHIKATRIHENVGKSKHEPYQTIRYYSGAIHAKQHITITNEYPVYEVKGSFKAPVKKGTWPAFWLTAVNGWPPELDILEFKGDSLNWQNTFITPKNPQSKLVAIPDADQTWNEYKAVLKKIDDKDIDIEYYINGELTATHRCNFMNKPLWLIINLQMEGSSGGPGPEGDTDYFIKDIEVKRLKN